MQQPLKKSRAGFREVSRGDFLRRGTTFLAAAVLPLNFKCGKKEASPPANLVSKGHPRYNKLRRGYNLRINQFPHAIAPCGNENQVSRAVRYARERGLKVTIKSSGHAFEGFSGNNNGLVIDLSSMAGQEYSHEGNRYLVGPAVQLAQAYDFLLPRGRLIPLGSCATVALGGLTLGGGYGLFSRRFGLSCDHLIRARMVDGKGRIVDTANDPELLWALRGGGNGNFGVVTSMEFQTVSMPSRLQAWRFKSHKLQPARAMELCRNWFALMERLPRTAFSAFVLNGTTLTILVTDTAARGPARIISELGKLMERSYTPTNRPLSRAVRSYYGVRKPLYFRNCSAGYYRDFSSLEKNIQAIFAQVTQAKGMIFQINTLGGKIADSKLRAGSAYAHRDFPFLGELQTYWPSGPQTQQGKEAFETVLRLLREAGVHRHYRNYPSLAFDDPLKSYYGEKLAMLRVLKARYDEEDIFSYAQSVKV